MNNQVNRVGEITFYYKDKPEISCIYLTETQRNDFLKLYVANTLSHLIIPYTGSGIPNLLNYKKKLFAATTLSAVKQAPIYEWCYAHDIHELKIRAA